MLEVGELLQVQSLFASSELQVRRDHAISHILAAIQNLKSGMVFYGGTALSRTFLADGRLSEDIDLYTEDRKKLCQELDEIPDLIEQEFPEANWQKMPSRLRDAESTNLSCGSSIQIRLQIVDSHPRDWQKVPAELAEIYQRYSDVSHTRLFVPTFDGFVAMKALAWFDRRAARDLFDLEALSRKGGVTENARDLVQSLRGYRLSKEMLEWKVAGNWNEELANQTKLERTEHECLSRVLEWWTE